MQEFLDKLTGPNGGLVFAVAFWGCVFATVVGTVSAVQWRKYRQSRMDAALARRVLDLKQQMVERDMSADEIERVLSAQPTTAREVVESTA